ncbi:hypothetical protein SDC9_133181 [bioreactor metagenome]|uniref:Uncharacterized protein n=1 Tax=bioreactor metagenome TaxID=1076179 RepID=A0A645DAJ9_9ZZZZ
MRPYDHAVAFGVSDFDQRASHVFVAGVVAFLDENFNLGVFFEIVYDNAAGAVAIIVVIIEDAKLCNMHDLVKIFRCNDAHVGIGGTHPEHPTIALPFEYRR